MANINTDIYDKKVNRAAMIRLYESKVSKDIMVNYNGHVERLDDLIKNSKIKRYPKSFYEELDKELIKTYGNLGNVNKRGLLDLVKDQASFTYNAIENLVGRIWKTQRPTRRIAEEIVLEQPLYKNKTLEAGWYNLKEVSRIRLEGIIRSGLADGLTEIEIANKVYKGSHHNISRMQALGLVRTSITSVTAQTDHQVYAANKNLLQGWQYVAVLDSRTTPLCAHRDGTIYPIDDTEHLPPAHFNCRSTTVPVVKSYDDLGKLEGISYIRKKNFEDLSEKQIEYYDGLTPLKESYDQWLRRQPTEIQLQHIGDYEKLEIFRSGKLTIDKFVTPLGREASIRDLRRLSEPTLQGETQRFAIAKEKLDAIRLGASRPDDFISDPKLQKALREYYLLQSGELDGTLSLTNYRGALIHTKKAMKQRVLSTPPSEEHLIYSPLVGKYMDNRIYQPNMSVLNNTYNLVEKSEKLLPRDKEFIKKFVDSLDGYLDANQRSVITENLRITFGRFRDNKEPWTNVKAVLQGQIKYDVMNVSDYIETQIRKDSNLLYKLKQTDFLDPVLGPSQLQDLHDTFISNIVERNKWEDTQVPKLGRRLRNILDYKIPVKIRSRLDDNQLKEFYQKFALKLSLADSPDRDQFAVGLGRDLYNLANWRGNRRQWYELGKKLLDDADNKGIFKLDTFGIQKRRMKSRMSGQYFGPYYDTHSVFLVITDPKIRRYAELNRRIDVSIRIGVTTNENRLFIRPGFKTYFDAKGRDTRIPITSTHSFTEFPTEFVDDNLANALNWASNTKYKIDEDYFDFMNKMLKFEDDKGKAQYYHELNEYRKFMIDRSDAYEKFKSMEWLRKNNYAFGNHPFLDHRGRVYERGMIGPQSGESFRPFLNTEKAKPLGIDGFENLQDQIGAFLGGASDNLEGRFNSLSFKGRQEIANKYRNEFIKIGNHMRRGKPGDIRAILENQLLAELDGEEQAKVLRLALEMSKIDEYLGGNYSLKNLEKLSNYNISLALEQDASSSGAQIIALTTRNKQLASLSNVIPTDQKKRLYDEIAAVTFNDPRFIKLNQKLGLTEKDLRKAAKQQNMVTLYGAGERTGILSVEKKLSDALGKQTETLVVKASERDKILNEISARMARYEKFDPDTYLQLKALREDVKDVLNKGLDPGVDMMEQLYFLDPKTRDVLEKLSKSYDKIVTPEDFKQIANIMSEHLREQVPILKDFTKFLGKLAEDYFTNAKPRQASIDHLEVLKTAVLGNRSKGKKLPSWLNEILGIKDESIRDKLLRRIPLYDPNSPWMDIIFGNKAPEYRRTGFNIGKYKLLDKFQITKGTDVLYPNKLAKTWTNAPWINFDGNIVEQNFTQTFEERLLYKDAEGRWITNILQVPQKTDPTWYHELLNVDGRINDIADVTKARTAFAVNGNHSNDAVIVKRFHLWGKKTGIPTSTVHDAFVTNAADMLKARQALREIYADMLSSNPIYETLKEMKNRGLPDALYKQYLNEAIDIGLIPVVGRSKINGKVLTEADILTKEDILKLVPKGFNQNYGWYGVG